MGADRHRHERGFRDEGQRPLAAHDQMGQDVDWIIEIDEGVHCVAHRVLHREEALDGADRPGIRADLVSKLRQPGVQVGCGVSQPPISVRTRGVYHASTRQDKHQRLDGAVGVELCPARHPARVVRDHPADRACRLASRVWPQHEPRPCEAPVDLPHRRTRLHPHPPAAVQDLDRTEVPTRIRQDPGGLRLSAQAGTA